MSNTNENFYSDPQAVACVVKNFMDAPIGSTIKNKCKNFNIITSEIIETEDINADLLDTINYTDLITLLEMSEDNNYSVYYSNSDEFCHFHLFNLFLYKVFILILQESAKKSITTKLFLNLPIKDFFSFLDSQAKNVSQSKKKVNLYKEILREMKTVDTTLDEDSSILSVMESIKKIAFKEWGIIGEPISTYKTKVLDSLELAKNLLATTFMKTFPDRFDAKSLKSRLKNSV